VEARVEARSSPEEEGEEKLLEASLVVLRKRS
jgi:hypothetical protein